VNTAHKDRSPIEIIPIGECNTLYKKLLTEDRIPCTMNETITKETTMEEKLITVTTEEVETAVKKLKIGKAAGQGNIPTELLKNAPQKFYKMTSQLFTICINIHTIPKEWKIAHIIPIFKIAHITPIFKITHITPIFKIAHITPIFKIAHITPIFKHGGRKNCDKYSAISVTNTFSRLLGRIVRDIIENEYSEKEEEE